MQKIYDLIAYLCSYVISNCHEDFFVHYRCITKNEQSRIANRIQSKVPLYIGSSIRTLYIEEIDDDFYLSLHDLQEELKAESDYFAMVGLIQALDQALEQIIRNNIQYRQLQGATLVLNTNRSTVGLGLLPRCWCCWERKKRLSHAYNRIDNFLSNLLVMENVILGNLIDRHIFLPGKLFKNFENSKRLCIAATPLRLERNFKRLIDKSAKVQSFSIEYDKGCTQKDNELIWQKIIAASEKKADIVVFPEMMGNYDTESYVQTRLMSLSADLREKMPALIVLPSCWKDNKNSVTVLDKYGNHLFVQSKQNPFLLEDDDNVILENIEGDSVINIMHYDGVGRIAILICKDFITTRYMEHIMRCFKLTLIIVPSFTTGSYDFRQSFDLCAHDDCNVVWINSCAALKKGKELNFKHIGYVRKRIGRFDDESQKLCKMKICDGAFSGTCMHDCLYIEHIDSV